MLLHRLQDARASVSTAHGAELDVTAVRGCGMVVFDNIRAGVGSSSIFESGDPIATFETLFVHVEFDSSEADRMPVVESFPGHPGQWICVYSSLERLREQRGEDIEYSCVRGRALLAQFADKAGIWYDRGFDGRKIWLPPPAYEVDAPSEPVEEGTHVE